MLNTMDARKSDRISKVLQRAARTVGVLGQRSSGGTVYDDIFNVSHKKLSYYYLKINLLLFVYRYQFRFLKL